jgi:hypothetical protein
VPERPLSPPPGVEVGRASSCWLHGCLILAVVVSSVLVIILVLMVMSRLGPQP